jgi:hypothetical protein
LKRAESQRAVPLNLYPIATNAQSVVRQSAPNVLQLAQSAQNDVQQNVLLHAQNVVHSISQLAPNDQQLAPNDQQLAPNAQLLVHSISQLAISRSRHVIVAQRLVAIASHILSLKHADAMLQKISVQMIHTSHQTWQMQISLIQHQEMRSRSHSAISVFQLH